MVLQVSFKVLEHLLLLELIHLLSLDSPLKQVMIFYVKDSCSVSSTSAWEGPASALTLCGTLTAPYSEDFEASQWYNDPGGFTYGSIDTCWNRSNISSSSLTYWWRPGTGTTPTNQTGPSGDHSSGSGKYLYTESYNGAASTTLISPTIDLDTLSTPELRFWYHMYCLLYTSPSPRDY